MDETPAKEPKGKEDSPSLDLSQLKGFSFGTQWSESEKSSDGKDRGSQREGFGKGRRKPQRPSSGDNARRDRRPPRRPRSNLAGDSSVQEDRSDRGDRQGGQRRRREGGEFRRGSPPPRPYESATFAVSYYPDDSNFSIIIKAMRTNHLTYELFEVAKLFLMKPERYVASISGKPQEGQDRGPKIFVSVPDNMPFASEDEALSHVMQFNADSFFDIEEVEVDPPSGNFQFVNRCPFTKVLLGPPNYHAYEDTLRRHHKTKLAHMDFAKLQSSIETVREEEVVGEWLESMKKVTRYTTRGEEPRSFDSPEAALSHLRLEAKDQAVREMTYARVPGTTLEKYPNTEAAKAANGELERQRRFPLDTANAIRGRMRREKFSIYKKGSKGVTYVCAAKRHFRTPGQKMSDPLDRIIRFLEANPKVKLKEMGALYEAWLKDDAPDVAYDEKAMLRDLHWLVADGYIGHYSDDTLFAQPVLENAPKAKPEPKAAEAKASEEASAVEEKPEEGGSQEAPSVTELSEAEPAIEAKTEEDAEAKATSESSSNSEKPAAEAIPVEVASEPEPAPEANEEEKAEAKETVEVPAESEEAIAEAAPVEASSAATSDQSEAEEPAKEK